MSKLRIIAGPNGSGKSTLIEYLRENFALSFGFYLNADEVEKSVSQGGRISFSDWNLSVKEEFLHEFLAGHPLAPRLSISGVRVVNNVLVVPAEAAGGYFAACLCDFVRKEWVKSGQSFTFETVMSGADKLYLLRAAREAGINTALQNRYNLRISICIKLRKEKSPMNLAKLLPSLTLVGCAAIALAHLGPESEHLQTPNDALCVTDAVRTGSAGNVYQSVPNWCQIPDGKIELGSPTHGGVFVDKDGLVYFTMDGGKQGIMVYTPEGKFVKSIADKYVGIHGVWLNTENGEQFIYAAWLAGHEALKLKMDGTLVWSIPVPKESGKYEDPKKQHYNPTGITVGPNGHVYVADGYGENWVHEFDENQKYVRSFGGRGSGDGQFQTCHGIALDTRGEKPLLLVCDRENHRLQHFDLDGKFVAVITKDDNHRPCSISFHGKMAAVAELDGRVAIIDENNKVVSVLGENPNKDQRANFNVPPADWKVGIFNAPHGVSYDKDGNLYVEDWNKSGRISKMVKVAEQARLD